MIGHGNDKAGKARAPLRQGHVEGSRCTRETRVRYPWAAFRADQPSAPPGSSAEAKIERMMADPETIYNWRRLDDRITTSGQPIELQLGSRDRCVAPVARREACTRTALPAGSTTHWSRAMSLPHAPAIPQRGGRRLLPPCRPQCCSAAPRVDAASQSPRPASADASRRVRVPVPARPRSPTRAD